jgi:hypothetical protein
VVRDEENDVARRFELLSKTAHRKDERGVEKLKDLVLERGEGAIHAVNESVHRNVGYLVPDQLNDVAHRLELSRETAHRTDERRVEILENLVVDRGKSVECAVGESAPHWACYGAQYFLSNDGEHRLLDEK